VRGSGQKTLTDSGLQRSRGDGTRWWRPTAPVSRRSDKSDTVHLRSSAQDSASVAGNASVRTDDPHRRAEPDENDH
jgi:hypothetical protein